jgi:hypothetical protein
MPLPYVFASATVLVLNQLDSNFNALGILAPTPCQIVGSNILALNPLANAAAVTAYSTGMQFSGVASASNSGATTAGVPGLATLPVYRDTPSGPAACIGGEIINGCAVTFMYDAALGGGAGGFHLYTSTTAVAGSGLFSSVSATLSQLGTVRVGSGAPVTRINSASVSLGTIVIGPNSSTDNVIAVSGVNPNDTVMVGGPASLNTGVGLYGFVSASGSITMRAFNTTGSSVTLAGAVYRVTGVGNT